MPGAPRRAWKRLRDASGFATLHIHGMRHTYASQRLQCLDRGEPVSSKTVSVELGYTTQLEVERDYGHVASLTERVRVEGFDYAVSKAPSSDTSRRALGPQRYRLRRDRQSA